MKIVFCVGLVILLALVCGCENKTPLNELPMYGGVQKTPEQEAADETFIQAAIKEYGTREKASDVVVQIGWSYLYKNDLRTAIKKFNQAWLLNSDNAQAYWGFGVVAANRRDLDQAGEMIEK